LATAASDVVYYNGEVAASSLGTIVDIQAGMAHVLVLNSEGEFCNDSLALHVPLCASPNALDAGRVYSSVKTAAASSATTCTSERQSVRRLRPADVSH
jgi:hypothetical protein